MSQTTTFVRKASIDLFVDERPQYPTDLKVHPESYTIRLPKDMLRSLKDVCAGIAPAWPTKPVEPETPSITDPLVDSVSIPFALTK